MVVLERFRAEAPVVALRRLAVYGNVRDSVTSVESWKFGDRRTSWTMRRQRMVKGCEDGVEESAHVVPLAHCIENKDRGRGCPTGSDLHFWFLWSLPKMVAHREADTCQSGEARQ